MVEYNRYLDGLFRSLADPVRRDILLRLTQGQHTVTQLAKNYEMSFAAVAKHLTVLEKAKLVIKRRNGKEQLVSISHEALKDASQFLTRLESLRDYRFGVLDKILEEENNHE